MRLCDGRCTSTVVYIMESEWSDNSVFDLISFYEANPLLWDPSCQEYCGYREYILVVAL